MLFHCTHQLFSNDVPALFVNSIQSRSVRSNAKISDHSFLYSKFPAGDHRSRTLVTSSASRIECESIFVSAEGSHQSDFSESVFPFIGFEASHGVPNRFCAVDGHEV